MTDLFGETFGKIERFKNMRKYIVLFCCTIPLQLMAQVSSWVSARNTFQNQEVAVSWIIGAPLAGSYEGSNGQLQVGHLMPNTNIEEEGFYLEGTVLSSNSLLTSGIVELLDALNRVVMRGNVQDGVYRLEGISEGIYKVKAIPDGEDAAVYQTSYFPDHTSFDVATLLMIDSSIVEADINLALIEQQTIDLKSTIKVMPNPASEDFVVEFKSQIKQFVRLEALDYSGSIYLSENYETVEGLNKLNVRIQSWPQGVYIINIYENGQIPISHKLIKK